MIYVIGSLRQSRPREIAALLRQDGHEVFDDWQAPGPQADDHWRDYEQERGRTFKEALAGAAAQNVFQFDKGNLDRADAAVLVMPAGKSAHLELGYVLGSGKPGYILLDGEPERWDVMYGFATGVFTETEALRSALGAFPWTPTRCTTSQKCRIIPTGV